MERKKNLRVAATNAERRLWLHLRGEQLGQKFRRQHEIAGHIVDFVCIERRLIVEVDGSQHFDQAGYDSRRTRELESLGFRVLRVWNNDVLMRTSDVLAAIHAVLAQALPPHPNPLPRQRRGRGSRSVAATYPDGWRNEERSVSVPNERNAFVSNERNASVPNERNASVSNERSASAVNPLPQAMLGGEGGVRGQRDDIRARLVLRARVYALIRGYFAERNVLEVETPILSAGANTDPNIESFSTRFSGHVDAGSHERWLRTSSEFPQKRLLAAGIGDCYELGRVFRNGEAGRRHNPEFTMLEWYRVGWNHTRLIDEVVNLVGNALALVGRRAEVRKFSYGELFRESIGIDPFTALDDELIDALGDVRVDGKGLGRDDWLDLLLTHRIQPKFPCDRITVIHDYPASQCALAKIRAGDPPVAERFELYLGSQELANGYHELTDAVEQRARFERDNRRRSERGLAALPIDVNLLAALEQGMPDCAGVALGVERLLMAMTGSDDIGTALAFPFARA
jgi:lysyl-tRNA synthetase class 2